jgi:hypothetical protein
MYRLILRHSSIRARNHGHGIMMCQMTPVYTHYARTDLDYEHYTVIAGK